MTASDELRVITDAVVLQVNAINAAAEELSKIDFDQLPLYQLRIAANAIYFAKVKLSRVVDPVGVQLSLREDAHRARTLRGETSGDE